ncbi:hypothetical protein HU200_024905 [Digitaria exilis]|uniref:Uncharacterized protein n=1 Tax=Digitaria exilis TaxID=1010633 RepID=A0A835EWG8_9POAL|nr:hypothetical protein HU200_024905 [Digitaria exilis]
MPQTEQIRHLDTTRLVANLQRVSIDRSTDAMGEEAANKQDMYTKDGSVDLRGRPVLASRTGRWKACAFLAFERMAFYGVASNLVETVPSVRNVNNWTGAVWMTPIVGAYIADTFLGRFWTFTIPSLIYLATGVSPAIAFGQLGWRRAEKKQARTPELEAHAESTLAGLESFGPAFSFSRDEGCCRRAISLHPQCTPGGGCAAATRRQVAFFYGALYTMAIGAGGTKPNISTFGTDQFDDFDARERDVKASFFNWWMFSSFTGGLVAVLVLVFVQENVGWGVGYTIPTVGLALSLLLFYVGTPFYRHPARRGSSLGYSARRSPTVGARCPTAWYAAAGKRRLHRTPAFWFLDRAALMPARDVTRRPCTVTEVEEVKLICGMILVWLTTLVPCTIWAQVNTLFVKQGTTLDRSLFGVRVPAASLGSFITISMLVSIPAYDRVLVPLVRRRTGDPRGITLLQRLGVGCALQVLVVACACLVEVRRMRVIRERSVRGAGDTVPMSVFWMPPQYVLMGVGDVFNSVGILEFFYDHLGTTFFTSGLGVGNFLNSLLVTLVDRATRGRDGRGRSWIGDNLNDSRLDYYYLFLLILSVLNTALFVWVAMRYKYKREFLDMEVERMPGGQQGKVDKTTPD